VELAEGVDAAAKAGEVDAVLAGAGGDFDLIGGVDQGAAIFAVDVYPEEVAAVAGGAEGEGFA